MRVRFSCGTVYDGLAFRAACREHYVLRCADTRKRQAYFAPSELIGAAVKLRAVVLYLRAQSAKGREVQVYGPFAELTAAGKRKARLSAAGDKRPQKDHGRAHFFHQKIWNAAAGDAA